MAKPIRVVITGSSATGTDAPTVDDLLGQIRDFVDVLRGVEKALEADGGQIVWRVTDVTKNSPLSFELTPYPTNPAAFVDHRADRVERATSDGFLALQRGVERPPYFTDEVLPKARNIYERIANGLSDTRIVFPADEAEPISINRETAQSVSAAAVALAAKAATPYRELGSLEGYFAKAELDGYNRPVLWFRHRLDNATIKAVATGKAVEQLAGTPLGEIWRGGRVRVYGTIFYKDLGVVDHVSADFLETVGEHGLPGLEDILDEDFTGGLSTEEYLREMRDE